MISVSPQPFFTSDDVRLLTDLGFAAAARQWLPWAVDIFEGMKQLRSTRSFTYVGLAMAYINARQPERAVEVLEKVLDVVQADERSDVLAFLGLAYQLAGRATESRKALQAAVLDLHPGDGRRMAAALLGLQDMQ